MRINKRIVSLILTIVGVAGVPATSYLSVRCSKKADEETEKKKKIFAYAPAIASGAVTAGCIIVSHHISAKEIAALTASCSYLVANRKRIEQEIKARFGEEAAEEIQAEVSKRELQEPEPPLYKQQTIEETGYGDVIFLEVFLGRKFKCSLQHVEWAEKQLNNDFHNGEYVSMNDFYRYLGIEETFAGYKFGWPANDDYYDYNLDTPINFVNRLVEDENGNPMYTIEWAWGQDPLEFWMEV